LKGKSYLLPKSYPLSLHRQFPVLQTLLGCDATAVKIASGQAISLLVEIARDHDMVELLHCFNSDQFIVLQDVDSECIELTDVLQDLAADSNRYASVMH